MKKFLFFLFLATAGFNSFSQETPASFKDQFERAKLHFVQGNYSTAYLDLLALKQSTDLSNSTNNSINKQELSYYLIACELMQQQSAAEQKAANFISTVPASTYTQRMNLLLGDYHFRGHRYLNAIDYYEKTGSANLTKGEFSKLQFNEGYSYFAMQKYELAKPLFSNVKTQKDEADYYSANYYYGLIAFRDKNYSEAKTSFAIAESDPAYAGLVAYYIAQINLVQGQTAEAISYVEKKLADQNVKQFYAAELHQLLGHLYFTQQNFVKATPHLSSYIDLADKVSREDVYELAYCHYKQNNLDDAIAGFRQLSGKEDSLSQHAMYLLGDTYIRKGDRNSARNAFLYCASNSSDLKQKEISSFQYAKLSYDLGFQDEALRSLKAFKADYDNSVYSKEATELLVDVLATTNNYKDALDLLESIKDPSLYVKRIIPRILYGRAMEFINDGNDRAASTLIDKALADINNKEVLPYLNFWKGELLFRTASYYQSIDFLNAYLKSGALVSADVSKENASYTLGYCYLRLKQYDNAKSYFEAIAKTTWSEAKPLNQDITIRLADCYYMLRDFAKAKSLYEKSVQYQWNSADYCTYQLAMIAGVKSSSQKIGLLTGLIKQFPASSLVNEAKMQIADTYMGDEKYKEAQPYLLDLIATSATGPFGPSAYLKSGIAYYNNDDNAKAIQQLKSLIDKYPNAEEIDDALDNLKAIYVEQGKGSDYMNYMHQIGRTLEMSTEDSLTYLTAEKLLNDQKAEEALESLQQYLAKFSKGNYVIDANYFIAQLLADKKDFTNAVEKYSVVIANAPNRYAESSLLASSRINFFELKDYAKAEENYLQLKKLASTQENRLESLRGLLRSQYLQQKWDAAASSGKELIGEKGVNADDKALNAIATARSYQLAGKTTESIAEFKSVLSLNKAALAAEARYEIAAAQFLQGNLKDAEKSAFETINKSGSYGFWVTRSYILLGDIYTAQKDYFNAKATFESVIENSDDEQLKKLAQDKLSAVIELEKNTGKIGK